MYKQRIIGNLIEKYNELTYSKPRYKLKDLYVGEIILINSRKFVGGLQWHTQFTRIKKFAIFYKKNDYTYVHIKSREKLPIDTAIHLVDEGDYAIQLISPFRVGRHLAFLKDIIKDDTKLSREDIEKLETEINRQLAPDQKGTETFGL
jgi:hypothetical protein